MLLLRNWSKIYSTALILFVITIAKCQNTTNINGPLLPAEITDPTQMLIEDLITPSNKCQQLVARFASAISNFTLCSVTNSRPIHLCQWCIGHYLKVVETHNDFTQTIDEKGNPCQHYFTNLDRIEIVSDAYRYVSNLWYKGNCDNCFEKADNKSIIPKETADAVDFEADYELTISCFNFYMKENVTELCTNCSALYEKLNQFYINITIKYEDNVCLDIVDTMNTTRSIWSQTFKCAPIKRSEWSLHAAMAIVMIIPILFYSMNFVLSTKTEASVSQQRRIAELFGTSNSFGRNDMTGTTDDASGYVTPKRSSDTSSRSSKIALLSEDSQLTRRRETSAGAPSSSSYFHYNSESTHND